METGNKKSSSKYMAGGIRYLVNQAIQNELTNLPSTLAEIKDPVQRLNFLTKFMPFVCAPIKQVGVITARRETGEDD
jgi:Ni,Fe-hydrogenase III large subunit